MIIKCYWKFHLKNICCQDIRQDDGTTRKLKCKLFSNYCILNKKMNNIDKLLCIKNKAKVTHEGTWLIEELKTYYKIEY